MLVSVAQFFAGFAAPRDDLEARLRLELFKAAGRNMRTGAGPYLAMFMALIGAQWAGWQTAGIWAAAVVGHIVLTERLRRRLFRGAHDIADAAGLMPRALAAMLPFHILWAIYVPLFWVGGDPINNAFLSLVPAIAIVATVQMYGPLIHMSLPATAVYLPAVATHAIQTGTRIDPVLPLFQTLVCALLAIMSLNHYRSFRETVYRRFAIEAMAAALARTKDAAERANHAKSTFLAGMSHELRTPLNAIIGFSDLIMQDVAGPMSPSRYRDYVADINASGHHLLALINDLLDLSKIEAGKRELQDGKLELATVARDAAQLIAPQAEKAGIAIRIAIAGDARLTADERAIRQILANLLSNAIKFSAPGSVVTVFAEPAKGGALSLGVRDTGIGMNGEDIQKALEPYGQVGQRMTVEGKGTGLGLPIVKALIEAHGALFRIESAPGRGTCVWGEFPAARVPAFAKLA